MSGGSYDYLFAKDSASLLGDGPEQDALERMVDRLAGLGYAADAAGETMAVLLEVRAARTRIDAMRGRLSDIWHAVEWWDSGDSREDAVKAALATYRGADPS